MLGGVKSILAYDYSLSWFWGWPGSAGQLSPRISQGVAVSWWLDRSHRMASSCPVGAVGHSELAVGLDSHTWPPHVPWAPSQRGHWAPRVEGPARQEEAALPPVTCLRSHTAPHLPPSGLDTHPCPQGQGRRQGCSAGRGSGRVLRWEMLWSFWENTVRTGAWSTVSRHGKTLPGSQVRGISA